MHSLYCTVQKPVPGKDPVAGNVAQLKFGRRNKQQSNSFSVRKLIVALILQKLQPRNIMTGGDPHATSKRTRKVEII